ncbi:MAG: hypothetical protein QOJ02_1878 [Acidobacteriota bacterium]|jgi:hypothetical protein|nr:hypothetical protein [Acidobacteriota bacterium]
MTALNGWENFYVIVGSSAGALIGLQFVVMTLISNMQISGANAQAGDTYSTPTVIHFGVVLLLAAVISAPWNGIATVAVLWGLVGLSGVVYVALVARRLRRQSAIADAYQAVFEDWLFHVLLPLAAYAMLAVSAGTAYSHPRPALFLVGAAALLLLFTGIHNAWDTVTYHVFVKRQEQMEAEGHR